MKRRKSKKDLYCFEEYLKTGLRNRQKMLAETLIVGIEAFIRPTDALPFHIPHSRVFYDEISDAERNVESMGQFYLPGLSISDINKKRPLTRKKLLEILSPGKQKSSTKDKEKQFGTIIKLPPLKKPVIKKPVVQLPKKGMGYLRKFPQEHLGDNGRVEFMTLLQAMDTIKSEDNYYLKYNLPKESKQFSPFDFRIVPFREVFPQDFYSISRKGMFHTRFGVVIYTPIKDLKVMYTSFQAMRKVKFFKEFLLIRIFKQWKTYVWKTRWINRKLELENCFLFRRKSLKNVIFDVRNLCYSLGQMSFFDDSIIEKLELEEFKKRQVAKVKKVVEKLKESRELVRVLVKNACCDELEETGHSLYANCENESLKLPKGLFKKKASTKELYKDYDKKKQCFEISRAVKFVDYLIQSMLHCLILNSLDHILSVFKKHVCYLNDASYYTSTDVDVPTGRERNSCPWFPMFLIDLQPTDDFESLSFVPRPSEWKILFKGLMELWIQTVESIKPLLNEEIFSPFTCPIIHGFQEYQILGNASKLNDILVGDFILHDKKRLVNFVLDKNIHIIHLYIERLHAPFCYYKEHCNTTREELKAVTDIERLRELLHESILKVDVLKKILPEQQMGLFLLTLANFQDMCLPIATRVNTSLSQIIPEIAIEKTKALNDEVQEALDYLDRYPKISSQFPEYLEAIEQMVARGKEFDAVAAYINDVHQICKDFKLPFQHEEYVRYFDMVDLTVLTQKKVISLRNNREEIIAHFRAAIRIDEAALSKKVSDILQDLKNPMLLDVQTDPMDVEFALHELNDRIQECVDQANLFRSFQRAIKDQVSRFEALEDAVNQIQLRQLLWESIAQWDDQVTVWLNGDFDFLNPEEMQQTIAKFLKNVIQFEKYFPPNNIVPNLRQKVERMRDKVPFIQNLRNPNIRPRHWLKLEQILNYKFNVTARKSLKLLEDVGIYDHQDAIVDISSQASSEASLEGLLKKIEDAWKALLFTVVPYKDATDVFILSALDEVNTILDETHINLSTIASSRSVGPIKPRVDDWAKKMDLFSRTLEEWTNCQTNWVYLEPIFSAPDIQRQLPTEAKMFLVVDKSWKVIMRNTATNPLALRAATIPGLLEEFERNNALLEEILKCLEAYLESKRVIFPRFYFLSNEELLEILAQTRNPHAVQPHLRKCFDAINKLGFGQKAILPNGSERAIDDTSSVPDGAKVVMTIDIISMISPEGEIIKLQKGLKARGNVEEWLGKVESAMFTALYRLMKYGIDDYEKKGRTKWVLLHASQIVLTVSQIMWSKSVHEKMDEPDPLKAVAGFEKKCFQDLNDLASMVRGKLEKVHRSTLCALITIDVHARDIITGLVNFKVDSSNNFEWIKQMRYYWDKDIDNCIACMASARHVYGYEYLGVSPRLVVTPLTDKCYLCLMGALQLDLGGAPAGPAGTGKTETTKDLAKALAIQCVVFNCSDGLDYKMMGRFFSGLAQSGAWCCFDEFNRIDIEVLSVIAQQLITIRNAKAAKLSRFMFEGREIKLIPQCATFITMNPGYAGRTELPDNLKSVFRPFAMMVPDYGLIAEVILYSEGFESSKNLAQKMVNMYKLCSEQLSQQDHYDFGMRAVKSVLVMAGSLKRENPDKSEDIVLIRALRDSNLPKFLADDAVLFKGILNDLFPGVILPEHDYGAFQEAMNYIVESKGLQPASCTFVKTIQLYETMVVRHGVMTVGPTGGGKTTVLNVLKGTLGKLYEDKVEGPNYRPVTIYTLNPKSVTMGELYGEVNLATMEWRDGLLGIFVRKAVRVTDEIHQWVVCDGPVDAVWIENLNTVLDDNKMLCLANSERIKLTAWVHMVFEVQDLSQASPATVSRCGMVYVDPNELKWLPYVKTWANTLLEKRLLNDDSYEYLLHLFHLFLDDGFEFIRRYCGVGIHQVEISKVAMLCSLLQNMLKTPKLFGPKSTPADITKAIIQIFAVAYIWSVGGNIVENARGPFESFVKSQFDKYEDVKLPFDKSFWDVFYSPESKSLQGWTNITPQFNYNPEIQFFDMLVPTSDTVCFGYFMERLLDENHPVFFTGTTGVGKSVIAKEVLNSLSNSKKWVINVLNFSAQTSSSRTQEMIELKLEKKRRTAMGAPIGKRMAVFVDDVNMPKLETYGAQAPIELLRQFLDFKGLYDREKLFWKDIEGMVLCCACAPPGGGRNPITPRFVRHFGMLFIPAPSDNSLKLIFTSILKGFLQDFPTPILATADNIVNSAVELYKRIAEDLLPTPAKSHYVFNLRDLSKCIQGVLQADSGVMRDREEILRLFFHECMRVFHDRLINIEDKSYFIYLLRDICAKYLQSTVIDLPTESGLIKKPPMLLFGDFLNATAEKQDRIYEEIKDISKLKAALQDALVDYNLIKATDMKLIFFMDAVEHVCRLARILRAERGNGLLVGVGGMGKQSLTKLGSHVNLCSCFQIELTRTYDYNSFHEDLRKLYFSAGGLAKDMVFLFNDTQIVMEEFLEDINNILNSGEVPNLFEGDELEKCIIACRAAAKQQGVPESNRDAIYDFFISQVRSHLHVVLCMSPVGEAFRRRCRMFPSLVNCCTIDWFLPWPEEALISVAKDNLKEFIDVKIVENMSLICFTMHSSVEDATVRFFNEMKRHYYVTPSSYLDLLKLYEKMLEARKKLIRETRERINNGLMKLFETNDLVASMKVQLVRLEPELAKKNAETAKLMVVLAEEKKAADEVRTVVLADEALAKEKAAECQVLKDDAQADLDLALPAMEKAVKALEALNKNDINEIKVFNKPPYLVKFVMESVCLLLGAKQDWASAKVVLGDTNFLKRLQDYDKDNIPDVLLKKLKKYIEDPQFVPDLIAATSKACKSLCLWVQAIDMYAKVYRVVEPKRKKLQAAEVELNAIMGVLRAKQARLADVEEQIAKLEASFDASLKEKAKLEATLELCATRMNRAGRLTSALADEQERWEASVQSLTGELNNLVGDVLVAAACVAYLGAFTSAYRDELSNLWLSQIKKFQIPASQTFSLIHILADPYEVRVWNTCGLPGDKVSVENGIYVTRASRWPLMIDPQEQANRWIRQMETDNNLRIVKLTDPNFMRTLESCIRLGLPMLIWEVGEHLDPTLRPVLTKSVFFAAGRYLIRLGDADVEYDHNFRLYVTTKLSNPHYLPEICIQVTLVNFTVTPSGLEDQLLADVVRIERPDLEKQRTELIVRINKDKGQLKAIEDKILRLLFASSGNILDDEELVETLNESKETSTVITTRLEETEETEAKITVAREGYRTVAERGSVLYFVVAHLAEIDPMYQFSLKYFKMVFNNVIEGTPASPTLEERLKSLIKEITLAIYNNVSRGLFEKDKLVYSFMLCMNILLKAGTVKESHWYYLLRGAVGTFKSTAVRPDIPAVTDMIWSSCIFLENLDKSFDGLTKNVANKIFVSVGDYKLDIILGGNQAPTSTINWNNRLDLFKKMMLMKALKEEKVIFAITEYVKVMLGKAFVESPLISLHILYADTNNITPLVFVLSTGSDPVGGFLRFAAETNNTSRINSISLGQGQGPIAYNLIERGKHRGDWVFLQNCHLASSWMLTMEKIVMDIADNPRDVHPEFRLFMSSMPSKAFPVSVLQNSVKVTNEPPKGLRSNVKRAFTEIQEEFFESSPLAGSWRKMIFGICFFHAVILERKKFGPLGWNIMYEFSDSDRECALLNLNLFCSKEKQGRIPWDALQYITGEITYGGRVTDIWDQRTLKTVLKKFFAPHTLDPGYKYSDSGTYYAPESDEIYRLVHYQEFIENLPLIEEPEIFGMHENANIAFQTKETGNVINTIMSVEVKESGGGEGKSSDTIVFELADGIRGKILSKISTDNVYPEHIRKDDRDRLPSLTTVMFQEVDRFNKMLNAMHSSIDNLKKAIKGFVVMSDDLEEVYKAFMSNTIPKMWSARSYPSLKSLGSWTKDLVLRIDFIRSWVVMGQPPSFWISGFFFPQGFMTGVLQTYARKYDFPIDELKIDFSVIPVTLSQEDIEEHHRIARDDSHKAYKQVKLPPEGVYVHGLFLDAARFDSEKMVLTDPNPGELNPPLPILWLIPSGKVPSNENRYVCPLYKTSVRAGVLSTTGHSTNFVIAVLLPSAKDESYWILKGTALLTQITD